MAIASMHKILEGIAERRPEIAEELQRLDERLGYLWACLDELQSRLDPVLAKESPPEPIEVQEAPRTAVGGMLRGASDRADTIGRRVSSILARLEV